MNFVVRKKHASLMLHSRVTRSLGQCHNTSCTLLSHEHAGKASCLSVPVVLWHLTHASRRVVSVVSLASPHFP